MGAVLRCGRIGLPSRDRTTGRLGQAGFSLIELIIAVVVLAAVTAGLASLFVQATATSADPLIRAQARAIAEGYVEEILLKAYRDPTDAETGGAEAGESRATFDDVWDYRAIGTEAPTDQTGNASADGDLDDYRVTVVIDGSVGGGPATIRATVRHTTSERVNYTLTSQRADY